MSKDTNRRLSLDPWKIGLLAVFIGEALDAVETSIKTEFANRFEQMAITQAHLAAGRNALAYAECITPSPRMAKQYATGQKAAPDEWLDEYRSMNLAMISDCKTDLQIDSLWLPLTKSAQVTRLSTLLQAKAQVAELTAELDTLIRTAKGKLFATAAQAELSP